MSQVLNASRPRARKAHRCHLCGGRIAPGEVYDRAACLYDGRVYDWVSCRGVVGCNEVSSAIFADSYWCPDYCDEGLGPDLAIEWAREQVRFTGLPLAAAYLTRRQIAQRNWLAARAERSEDA